MKSFMESPYGSLDDAFPDAVGKLVYCWEDEVQDEDNFKPPATYYVSDAMGGQMFFRTNKRASAQHLCDCVFGKNKYTVKIVVKAQVR